MTVKEGTICSLIQSFPVFLILAQNAQKCVKTPLVYKPPSPTHSPEYYEALDALFQSLYGHGYPGNQGTGHGYPGIQESGYGYPGTQGIDHVYPVYQTPSASPCQSSYGYGKKWSSSPSYGGSKPCYQYVYTSGNNYHTYGSGLQGYPNYGAYGLKKGNIYALSGNVSTTGYAPTQVYNTKNRYQVVVKKTRIGGRKKNGKILGGFFPQRENRNNGVRGQGLFQRPRRVKDRQSGFFNFQPDRPAVTNTDNNQDNIYVIEIEGDPQNGYNNFNGQNFERPVAFPTNNPVYANGQNNGNVNFQPNPQNGNYEIIPGNGNFQLIPDNGNFQLIPVNGNFQPNPDNGNFQQNNDNGNANFNQNQPAQDEKNNEYQDQNNQENNNVRPNEDTVVVSEENDAVNFEDTPNVPLETTTSSPTTSSPPAPEPTVDTESRNNFNFQMPNQGLFRETCDTVEGGLGSCISVYTCQPYLSVLKESRTNPNAVQLLRRAHCGFEGSAPKVCCPLPGIPATPQPPPPTPAPTPAPTQAPTPVPKTNSDFVAALPDPPVCGFSNATFGKVVGGIPAKLGDFPWMALLGYKSKRSGDTKWLCGGSLISSRHVLTAAHCIHNHEDDLYVVRLGELDLEAEDGATPIDILIKQKIKHEQYSATAFTNDIGILVLENEVTFTDLISPICIPKDSALRATTFEDYNPMIAGWGHTMFRGPPATHLMVLQLPVVGNDYCTQAYSAYKAQKIDERVLCAGFKQGGKDACQGDSGGPLMQPIWTKETLKTYFYQIGVVSYGKKCAEANFPGVYSRVTHFVPWIEEKVVGYSSS